MNSNFTGPTNQRFPNAFIHEGCLLESDIIHTGNDVATVQLENVGVEYSALGYKGCRKFCEEKFGCFYWSFNDKAHLVNASECRIFFSYPKLRNQRDSWISGSMLCEGGIFFPVT